MPDNPEFTVVSTKQKKRIGCTLPWTETMINWDGSVLPCCAVYSEKVRIWKHPQKFLQRNLE